MHGYVDEEKAECVCSLLNTSFTCLLSLTAAGLSFRIVYTHMKTMFCKSSVYLGKSLSLVQKRNAVAPTTLQRMSFFSVGLEIINN